MKIKISIVVVVLFTAVVYYLYTEMNGLPWKHAEVKQKAIVYMKQKYNMDVAAAGSSYNFKFKVYTAKVHNMKDTSKAIIHVEDDVNFDDNGNSVGKQLQDDYSLVYWSAHIRDSLQKNIMIYSSNRISIRFRLNTPITHYRLEEDSAVIRINME